MTRTCSRPSLRPTRLPLLAVLLSALLPAAALAAPPLTFVMQVFPPFNDVKGGQPVGVFPEVLREVCAAMQTECKLEVYPWRRAYALAQSGMADGILLLLKTPQREQIFHMGAPVIQSSYVLYAQQQNPMRYTGPADLAGYTIGAYGPSGTSYAATDLIQAIPDARLEVEMDNPTALRKLRLGRYGAKGAVFINLDLALHLMKQEGDAGLKQVGEVQKVEYYIGLSRKKMSVRQAELFHATLRQLQRDGTVAAIARKHGLKAAAPR
ncbi:ABC transporter substrate-binding protein [Massilia sp. Root351]|uniref:substrate-binding periplasmic protein n=1 Tax=Massilia sp. Root351 TaxID=1736522 RepID=UPI0009EC3856|nr:transporter substrate-binding domain-containing protein [Massilia sp. Root351]